MRSELKRALVAYGMAVRKMMDLGDLPEMDPVTEYHLREYSSSMVDMLMEQLLTSAEHLDEADAILSRCSLDFLAEDLHIKAGEWNKEL